MAIGYSDKVVRRLKASVTLTQYQVVKQNTNAGEVTVCLHTEKPYGIVMADVDQNGYVNVCVEGSYFAKAADSITRPAILAVAAAGTVITADSNDAYILGVLGDDQASCVTNDIVKVVINKSVVSIA